MTLQTYCDKNGINYTLRPATETRNARLTLDGQWLTLHCHKDFDPNAEVRKIGDWLKISDTSGDYAMRTWPGEFDGEICNWGEQKAPRPKPNGAGGMKRRGWKER